MYNLNQQQEAILEHIKQGLPEELKLKFNSILTNIFLYGYEKGAKEGGRRYDHNRRR